MFSRVRDYVQRITCLQIDETLSELDKCVMFLGSDEDLQVQAAFKALPKLVAAQGRLVFARLRDSLKAAVPVATAEGSIALAEALSEVLNSRTMQVRLRRALIVVLVATDPSLLAHAAVRQFLHGHNSGQRGATLWPQPAHDAALFAVLNCQGNSSP